MIKLIRHLWSHKEGDRNWLDDMAIDEKILEFYAPYENESDIYSFKIGDVLRDTYTNQDYRAVDKIKKKSRWGEERDVFILKSLKSSDQFGLEHSPEGFGGLRYHKKYQILISPEDWVGYLPLQELFRPIVRAHKEEIVLPPQPGILFFYNQDYQLQYMEKTRNLKETASNYFVHDEETPVQAIRHLFHFLCYIKKGEDDERSALYYFLRNKLEPKWDQNTLVRHGSKWDGLPEFDRYKQIFRFSLTVEDLIKYFERKKLEQSVDLEEIREIARYIESLKDPQQIEEIMDQVIEGCLKQYHKEDRMRL